MIAKAKTSTLTAQWPADALLIMPEELYPGYNCLRAWQVFSRTQFVGIVETVRNRVLSFALEIEAADPDAGEAPPGTAPLSPETVQQVFNNNFYGHVGNVATGSSHFTQEAILTVQAGDLTALKTRLTDLGVPKESVAELESALASDKQEVGAKKMGPRTAGWIGKTMSMASSGVLKIGTSAAASVLAKLICGYLGIPS